MDSRFKKDIKLAVYVAIGFLLVYLAFPLLNHGTLTDVDVVNAVVYSYFAIGLMIAFAFWRDKTDASE